MADTTLFVVAVSETPTDAHGSSPPLDLYLSLSFYTVLLAASGVYIAYRWRRYRAPLVRRYLLNKPVIAVYLALLAVDWFLLFIVHLPVFFRLVTRPVLSVLPCRGLHCGVTVGIPLEVFFLYVLAVVTTVFARRVRTLLL